MRRVAALLAPLVLATAAPAAAAPFGELSLQLVSPGAACVRATGAPGELVRWMPRGARVWQAGDSASTPVTLGAISGCPVAAAQPGGAGAVAGLLTAGGIAVAVRDPGGGWAAPVRVRRAGPGLILDLAVAVSPRGDAVVAWIDGHVSKDGDISARVLVARRAPGGAFGAAAELARWPRINGLPASVLAGADDSGEAIVAWTQPQSPTTDRASVAIAPAAAPFGTPQGLATAVDGRPALAVTPAGSALLSLPGKQLKIAERAPGAPFQPASDLPGGGDESAVALRPDGAAVVAWGGTGRAIAAAVVRTAPGAFGPALDLGNPLDDQTQATIGVTIAVGNGPAFPLDSRDGDIRVAYAGDGRPVVTWAAHGGSVGGFDWTAALVTTLAGDAFAPAQALGSPLRDAGPVAPVILPSGVPAVAWGDDDLRGNGHLHLAVEGGTAAPQAPFPQVRVGAPVKRVLRTRDALVLPVTCSAACDVRARLGDHAQAFASLSRAGTTTLRIIRGDGRSIAPARPGAVAVQLISGPPGAAQTQSQTVSVRLRRAPAHTRVVPVRG